MMKKKRYRSTYKNSFDSLGEYGTRSALVNFLCKNPMRQNHRAKLIYDALDRFEIESFVKAKGPKAKELLGVLEKLDKKRLMGYFQKVLPPDIGLLRKRHKSRPAKFRCEERRQELILLTLVFSIGD